MYKNITIPSSFKNFNIFILGMLAFFFSLLLNNPFNIIMKLITLVFMSYFLYYHFVYFNTNKAHYLSSYESQKTLFANVIFGVFTLIFSIFIFYNIIR